MNVKAMEKSLSRRKIIDISCEEDVFLLIVNTLRLIQNNPGHIDKGSKIDTLTLMHVNTIKTIGACPALSNSKL